MRFSTQNCSFLGQNWSFLMIFGQNRLKIVLFQDRIWANNFGMKIFMLQNFCGSTILKSKFSEQFFSFFFYFGFNQNSWMWCKMILLKSYNGGVKLQYFQVCKFYGYSILWQLLYCNFSYSKMVISDIITRFTIWWFIFYFDGSPQRWHATFAPVMKRENDQGSVWKPIPKSTKRYFPLFDAW